MSENRKEIGPKEYLEHFKRNTALIVTMDNKEKLNMMALDWKAIQDLEGKPVIRAQVAYSRYTYKLLTEGVNEFTINIPTEKMYEAVDIAGCYSGRDIDKIKKAGLETVPGKNTQIPTIKGCILSYECKIVHESNSNMSSHHYFYGEILTAYASIDLK